jgi:hypothetical protein
VKSSKPRSIIIISESSLTLGIYEDWLVLVVLLMDVLEVSELKHVPQADSLEVEVKHLGLFDARMGHDGPNLLQLMMWLVIIESQAF